MKIAIMAPPGTAWLSAATYPSLYRYRIASVTNETGGDTDITYGNPDPCPASYTPSNWLRGPVRSST